MNKNGGYSDLLLQTSQQSAEQEKDWDGLVLKQAELQNKMAILRKQQELDRKSKYKQALEEQRQEAARNKSRLKALQHSADQEEREQISLAQNKEIEEKRMAKETRAEELRRLMDNNMRQLQKRKESEVSQDNGQNRVKESDKNFYNVQFQELEHRNQLLKDAQQREKNKIQMNLKQSYDLQKQRRAKALMMEKEHDRDVQERLAKLMHHDKSDSWREFHEKQKQYLEKVQQRGVMSQAKKDALINTFSVNAKLEQEMRQMAQEEKKREILKKAISDQQAVLRAQMEERNYKKIKESGQKREYAKFIDQSIREKKELDEYERMFYKEQNHQLRQELVQQIKDNMEKNSRRKEMTEVERKLMKNVRVQLPGLENPIESNSAQSKYLDKFLGIDPNRPRRLKKYLSGSQDNKQLYTNISLPEIQKMELEPDKTPRKVNYHEITKQEEYKRYSMEPKNDTKMRVIGGTNPGASPQLRRNLKTISPAEKREDLSLQINSTQNTDIQKAHTQLPTLEPYRDTSMPKQMKRDQQSFRAKDLLVNSGANLVTSREQDLNDISVPNMFEAKRSSQPYAGLKSSAIQITERKYVNSNESSRMGGLLNQRENPYSLQKQSNPVIQTPAAVKYDPITGVMNKAPSARQFEVIKQAKQSPAPRQYSPQKQERFKLWELNQELDQKIKKTLKTTNFRNEYGNVQSAGEINRYSLEGGRALRPNNPIY